MAEAEVNGHESKDPDVLIAEGYEMYNPATMEVLTSTKGKGRVLNPTLRLGKGVKGKWDNHDSTPFRGTLRGIYKYKAGDKKGTVMLWIQVEGKPEWVSLDQIETIGNV